MIEAIEKTSMINEDMFKYREIYYEREDRLQKYKKHLPHSKLNNFHTLKWLSNKLTENVKYRSLMKILPNEGISLYNYEKDEKKKIDHQINDMLSRKKERDLYKDRYNNISTKYLYSVYVNEILENLKDMFIEIDSDGSGKLDMKEMKDMFKRNKIPINIREIEYLFFDKKNKYVDFVGFKNFLLDEQKNQKFRVLMRKIKQRVYNEFGFENTKKSKEWSNQIYNDEYKYLSLNNYDNRKNEMSRKLNRVHIESIFNFEKEIYNNTNTKNNCDIPNIYNNPHKQSNTNINDILHTDRTNNSNNYKENQSETLKRDFIPMSFYLLIDYFNKRGKLKDYVTTIENTIVKLKEHQKIYSKMIKQINETDKNNKGNVVINNNEYRENRERIINEEIEIEDVMLSFQKLFNQEIPKEKKPDLVSLLKIRKGNTKRLKNEDELMIENFLGTKVKTNYFIDNIFHSQDSNINVLDNNINQQSSIILSYEDKIRHVNDYYNNIRSGFYEINSIEKKDLFDTIKKTQLTPLKYDKNSKCNSSTLSTISSLSILSSIKSIKNMKNRIKKEV